VSWRLRHYGAVQSADQQGRLLVVGGGVPRPVLSGAGLDLRGPALADLMDKPCQRCHEEHARALNHEPTGDGKPGNHESFVCPVVTVASHRVLGRVTLY
jgi:hypothetical protein